MSCRANPPALVDVQTLKDRIHTRLLTRCEEDLATGCWVYTGAWHARTEAGVMRFAGKQWPVARLSAWVFLGGFDLEDRDVTVRRKRCCTTPACFHFEHLVVRRRGAKRRARVLKMGRPEGEQGELFAALQ